MTAPDRDPAAPPVIYPTESKRSSTLADLSSKGEINESPPGTLLPIDRSGLIGVRRFVHYEL